MNLELNFIYLFTGNERNIHVSLFYFKLYMFKKCKESIFLFVILLEMIFFPKVGKY